MRALNAFGDDTDVAVFEYCGASHSPPLNPRRLAQRFVHARLPAGALGAEGGDYVLVQAEGDLGLGRAGRAASPDDGVADADFGAVEPVVIELRRVVRVNPAAFRDDVAFAHWPSSTKSRDDLRHGVSALQTHSISNEAEVIRRISPGRAHRR
jgi:hypothetical protein